jgi:hypothetical protein
MAKFPATRRLLLAGLVGGIAVIALFFEFRGRERTVPPGDRGAMKPVSENSLSATTGSAVHSQNQATMTHRASDGDEGSVSIPADRPRFLDADSPARVKSGQHDVMLEKTAEAVRDYRIAFKQNPVGTNTEITRALSGKNSRHLRYLPNDARTNGKGELIDSRDQPVYFHQISATVMEIRSAGPDHIMWTSDDDVLR